MEGIVMSFLQHFMEDQSVSNVVDDLDCFIDTRCIRVYRQFYKTEEYRKMAVELEKFREQFRKLNPELFEEYEKVLMEEQGYVTAHEYLQGVFDGVALRNVFYSLHLNEPVK
jgi:hypothetical protein